MPFDGKHLHFFTTKIFMWKMNSNYYFLGHINIYESTNGMLIYSRDTFCCSQQKIHAYLDYKCTSISQIIGLAYVHHSLTMAMFWTTILQGNRIVNGSDDCFSYNCFLNSFETIVNALSSYSVPLNKTDYNENRSMPSYRDVICHDARQNFWRQ
jgi:hypothetical protein